MKNLLGDGILTSLINKYMRLIVISLFLALSFTSADAQRIEIGGTKFRVVSLDPNSRRIFVCYDYLFPSEAPHSDSTIQMNLRLIKDTLQSYVRCLFELESISFFKSSAYSRYGPPVDLDENKEWGKQYLAEYNIAKGEYIRFPALKKRKKIQEGND
ncbi:MAG: hypothetical protein JNK14_07600 [Chitinophagaceae bacterium]|nr:hypothetical protein [Chitinophagaceae bacterium]